MTGARRFVSDLDLRAMLHGAVLRPPTPGSVLRTVDTTPAEEMTGVTVVRDGQFVGVTAPDLGTARRAVAAITADWQRPPAGAADMTGYLRCHPTSGQGWDRPADRSEGDTGAALASAATRVEVTYTAAYLAHVPLETRAAVAAWDGGRLTVWTGCNVPFAVRAQLAATLGIGEADVRVIVPRPVAVSAESTARKPSRPLASHARQDGRSRSTGAGTGAMTA